MGAKAVRAFIEDNPYEQYDRLTDMFVNGYFENHLGNFQLNPNVGELFKMVVLDYYRSANREELDERKFIATKIEEQEKVLSNARKRFMTEEIDVDDFKAIKVGCSKQLKRLDAKLSELPAKSDTLKSVEELLNILMERYSDIKSKYKMASLEDKRNIIGSMYPENLRKWASAVKRSLVPLFFQITYFNPQIHDHKSLLFAVRCCNSSKVYYIEPKSVLSSYVID